MTENLTHKLGMQHTAKKLDADIMSREKNNIPDYPHFSTKPHMSDCFHSSDNREGDKDWVKQPQTEYTMNLKTFSLV